MAMAEEMGGGGDVGELLAFFGGGDAIDKSAPLSTPDLHHLLQSMQQLCDGKRDHVLQTLKSNHPNLLHLISKPSLALSHLQATSHQLSHLLHLADKGHALDTSPSALELDGAGLGHGPKDGSEVEEAAFDVRLRRLVDDARSLNRLKEDKKQALALVGTIVSLYDRIDVAKEDFASGRIVESARAMCELREALRLPSDLGEDVGDGLAKELHDSDNIKVYLALRLSWIETFSHFRSTLDDLFSQGVRFDMAQREISVAFKSNFGAFRSDDGAQQTAVLRAFDCLGLLETSLSKLADMLFKTIILPILENPLAVILVEDSPLLTDGGNVAVLRVSLKDVLQTSMTPLEALFSKILEVIKFLRKYVLDNQDPWMKQVGRLIWPRLAEAIIFKHLQKIVPIETIHLVDFQRVANIISCFEKELKKESFLGDIGPNGDKLSEFALDVEAHFASKKRKNILAKVRHILVQFDYQLFLKDLENTSSSRSPIEPAKIHSELLFQLETCVISPAANKLLLIVHEAIKDACFSTPRTAIQLYHAARDSVLLFRAIIPVKLVGVQNNLDQVAAVYHNDSLYIANELLGLAYQG